MILGLINCDIYLIITLLGDINRYTYFVLNAFHKIVSLYMDR